MDATPPPPDAEPAPDAPATLRDILSRAATEDAEARPHDEPAAAETPEPDATDEVDEPDSDAETPEPEAAPEPDPDPAAEPDADAEPEADADTGDADETDPSGLPPLGVDEWADGRGDEPRRRGRLRRLAPVIVIVIGLLGGTLGFIGVQLMLGKAAPDAAATTSAVPEDGDGDEAAVASGEPSAEPAGEASSEPGASADAEGSVEPSPAGHTLRIAFGGTGAGTVISRPAGLSCSSASASCEGWFPDGTVVIISAVPQDGSIVEQWVGCDSVSGPTCVHAMVHDQTAAVTFLGLETPSPAPTATPAPTNRPAPVRTTDPSATRAPGQTLDPGADTDGDSFPNEMEETFGSDPLDEASTPENAVFVNLDNVSTCEDGIDNDLDGDFDAADQGCR